MTPYMLKGIPFLIVQKDEHINTPFLRTHDLIHLVALSKVHISPA